MRKISIALIILGVLIASLVLIVKFAKPCDFGMAGIECECKGVHININDTFLDVNGDTQPEGYCYGEITGPEVLIRKYK